MVIRAEQLDEESCNPSITQVIDKVLSHSELNSALRIQNSKVKKWPVSNSSFINSNESNIYIDHRKDANFIKISTLGYEKV